MYVPKHFKEENQATLHQYIRDNGLGLLIITDDAGIEANHVPFHLCAGEGESGEYLHCHLARGNPVWQRLQDGARVLVVFQGPHAYVSPSWYPSKAETGRVVPTWNYLAVHVEGTARVIEDPAWLMRHLHNLTDHHEAGRETPWAVDDAPAEFTERLLRAIVGVEIRVDKLTGKLKASQNQSEQNRAGVRAGLENMDDPLGRAMAGLIN